MRRPERHMWTTIQSDRHRRDDGERAVEPFLVGGMEEQLAAEGADARAQRRCPSAPRKSARARPDLRRYERLMATIEEGLETFAKSDDERLKHDARSR